MGKSIIYVVMGILLMSIAFALNYDFVYNPYTSYLDAVLMESELNTSISSMVNASLYDWKANVDANDFHLTELGELVMSGVITSYNIIPYTTELYSLGNSTNWYEEAYIKNLYSVNINTSKLDALNVNSDNVDVDENLTFKNITIKENNQDLVIILTG